MTAAAIRDLAHALADTADLDAVLGIGPDTPETVISDAFDTLGLRLHEVPAGQSILLVSTR
ncbi:hypothetical protein [Leifsonia sp. Leaf264]|uniref:hypothetical protein n=1 Tax=Leifsonia sp. Leaf264 TaxID=1736314 RepID=UPI0006F68B1B|nr:hypothetical protein [Leifsonia sp. Leaf264]KQO98399.1 hypothetical protein ASF30_10080 [Leifsonia sp. Leaf264]